MRKWLDLAWLELQFRLNYRAALTGLLASGKYSDPKEVREMAREHAIEGCEEFKDQARRKPGNKH